MTEQLAYVVNAPRGATDRALAGLAARLMARGRVLAGVVQHNSDCVPGGRCDMDLQVLPDGPVIRISQSLGPGARGCRLDPAGLEQAVALVAARIEAAPAPDLLIVNKFGKHEAEGRGFRPLIAEALARDIPVLVGVNGLNEARFLAFAGGAARRLADTGPGFQAWFEAAAARGGTEPAA